jgi:muconolactone delta-isomerase
MDTLVEFLVQFELDIPDEGDLVRLWRVTLCNGRTIALGLYPARGRVELDEISSALPLYEWMHTSITPIVQHSDDPASA